MTYDIYRITEIRHDGAEEHFFADKFAQMEMAANDDCCHFGSLKLWDSKTGFVTGKIREGNYLLVSRS
jgi:hypothetical protein